MLTIFISSHTYKENKKYDFNKKYGIKELREDLKQLRLLLESNHPRLYEYTSKESFDIFFDSLDNVVNTKMTEREFQFFLSPVIGKIHCSHTKLLPSEYLMNHLDEYISSPPFKLYFTDNRAFFQANFSKDTSIKIGAEVLSINGIKTAQLINNFSSRIHNEGKNTSFIFNRLNFALHGLFPALCDYPNIDVYTLKFINPKTKFIRQVKLKAINENEYRILNHEKLQQYYSFKILDSLNTGIIKVSSFNFQMDSIYTNFIYNSFNTLKSKKIQNLIVDIRGNIGGQPYPATELLKNITSKEFIYYSKKTGYEKFNNIITPTDNYFRGNIYFLIDGGCRSTTGHFTSLVKYHNIGTLIGEETCASYSCNSSSKTYTLNNSKLTIDCPTSIFEVAVQDQIRGKGITPDIYLKPTIENVLIGKDTVLIFILKKIKMTENKPSH